MSSVVVVEVLVPEDVLVMDQFPLRNELSPYTFQSLGNSRVPVRARRNQCCIVRDLSAGTDIDRLPWLDYNGT